MANSTLKLLLLAAITLLSGCRLEVIVPEGGRVTSASGNFDCSEASTCQENITRRQLRGNVYRGPQHRLSVCRLGHGNPKTLHRTIRKLHPKSPNLTYFTAKPRP